MSESENKYYEMAKQAWREHMRRVLSDNDPNYYCHLKIRAGADGPVVEHECTPSQNTEKTYKYYHGTEADYITAMVTRCGHAHEYFDDYCYDETVDAYVLASDYPSDEYDDTYTCGEVIGEWISENEDWTDEIEEIAEVMQQVAEGRVAEGKKPAFVWRLTSIADGEVVYDDFIGSRIRMGF